MAEIHSTTLSPGKLELLTGWLPTQPWYAGGTPVLARAGGFRLDDPEGEVGLELMFVADGSAGTQVCYLAPMAYRASPLDGADAGLIGTSEHGVLGTRWIYDGACDPVLVSQLVALLTGRAQAQQQRISDTPDLSVEVVAAAADPATPALPQPVSTSSGTRLRLAGEPPLTLLVCRRLEPAADPVRAAGSVTALLQGASTGARVVVATLAV